MQSPSILVSLLLSAAAGFATVSSAVPPPVTEAKAAAMNLDAEVCAGYLKLHVRLASTSALERFADESGCVVELRGALGKGLPAAGR